MLRGSSSVATRSDRNRMMRRAGSCPSLSSSFVAAGSKSIRQAMRLHHVAKRHRRGAAGADVRQTLFGEIDVFQIIDVFEDRFSRIERLGTPCRERERLKASFNVFRESDGKHGKFHQLLYTYSLAWNDDRGVSHRSMRGLRVSSQTFANTRR